MLYYGRDVVAMQNKRAEERKERKKKQQSQLMEGAVGDDDEEGGTTMKQSHKSVSLNHEATAVIILCPPRRDFYTICQEAGLGSLAARFGLSPEQFGENLRDNYQRHETTQYHAEPEDAAQEYIQTSG